MSDEWRKKRLRGIDLTIGVSLVLMYYTFLTFIKKELSNEAVISALILLFVIVLDYVIIFSSKLRINGKGLTVKGAHGVKEVEWTNIISFILMDDFRIKLGLSKGGHTRIEPSRFRDPHKIVEEIRQHLGEPEIRRSRMPMFYWLFMTAIIVIYICYSPPVFSLPPLIGIFTAFFMGCGIGGLGAAYIWKKEHRPIEEGELKYTIRGLLDFWGIFLGMPVILYVYGIHSNHMSFLIGAIIVGRLLGSGIFRLIARYCSVRPV